MHVFPSFPKRTIINIWGLWQYTCRIFQGNMSLWISLKHMDLAYVHSVSISLFLYNSNSDQEICGCSWYREGSAFFCFSTLYMPFPCLYYVDCSRNFLYLWFSWVFLYVSAQLSWCTVFLEATEILKSMNVCLSTNSGHFHALFLQIFSVLVTFLSFWD